jgi:hypothetical protein
MNNEPTIAAIHPHDTETPASIRLLSRLRSDSLDRQLAAGTPPGWSRTLAARADYLTSPEHTRGLAEDWEHLLHVARRPAVMRTPRTPLCRDRILAAEAEIRDLIAALSTATSGSAAGVATTSLLLRDGSGPLYNWRCPTDLAETLQNAATQIRKLAATVDKS